MAIIEVRPRSFRNAVAWHGGLPSADVIEHFKNRELSVEAASDADLADPSFLAGLSAVVFIQSASKPTRIVGTLTTHAKRLLDHGCQIILIIANKHPMPDGRFVSFATTVGSAEFVRRLPLAGISTLTAEEQQICRLKAGTESPLPHVRFVSQATDWHQVANAVFAAKSGPAPSKTLAIELDDGIVLDPTQELLLQRAFADCAKVHLVEMDDEGKSGASVYRAYAELQKGLHGRWLQPFFVKLGPREKIFKEYENYLSVVDPYVPFHLGPRLINDRCHLGADQGIIVGDFVERSESLQECAKRGRAAHAISGLFHTTLQGWYRAAQETTTPITAFLSMPSFQGLSRRLRHARRLGATKNERELQRLFNQSAAAVPVLAGPIHGDLHATNILVRAGDAILIDFLAHHDQKPLLYDAACLEASLLVDGFKGDSRGIGAWLKSVEALYDDPLLDKACATSHPKDPSAWFFACAAQIRLYARDMQRRKGQYAAALAIALLRKASKDPELKHKENFRRAAAYVLAEKILSAAFKLPVPNASARKSASRPQKAHNFRKGRNKRHKQ